MKDGRISSHESRSLDELQRILGLSDRQMTKVAAKHAIERSLKRNRITTEQYAFIQEAASLYDNDAYVLQLNNIDVESGRLKKSNRMVLESSMNYWKKKSDHRISVRIFSSSVLIMRISVPNSGGMFGSSYNSSSFDWDIAMRTSSFFPLFSNQFHRSLSLVCECFEEPLGHRFG